MHCVYFQVCLLMEIILSTFYSIINKNITKTPDHITGKPYTVSSPKTMSSYRTIPIPNFLLEYYKDLYDDCSSYYNFNDNWYVFGNIDPLPETTLRDIFNGDVNDDVSLNNIYVQLPDLNEESFTFNYTFSYDALHSLPGSCNKKL